MTNQQPNGQTTSLTQNSRTRQITLIGLMTAITCILAPLSIPLPFSPVPISLTNLVIFISVFILGMKDATISFLIYLLLLLLYLIQQQCHLLCCLLLLG